MGPLITVTPEQQSSAALTDSGGRCPALCLRGGRGLTWVTWRKGEPLVGRVDKHSQDAEWLRGAGCGGAGGVGEGLASSPKPATRQQSFPFNGGSGSQWSWFFSRPCDELPAEGHSLSLEETGRILLVLELRFLMAIVSFGGKV